MNTPSSSKTDQAIEREGASAGDKPPLEAHEMVMDSRTASEIQDETALIRQEIQRLSLELQQLRSPQKQPSKTEPSPHDTGKVKKDKAKAKAKAKGKQQKSKKAKIVSESESDSDSSDADSDSDPDSDSDSSSDSETTDSDSEDDRAKLRRQRKAKQARQKAKSKKAKSSRRKTKKQKPSESDSDSNSSLSDDDGSAEEASQNSEDEDADAAQTTKVQDQIALLQQEMQQLKLERHQLRGFQQIQSYSQPGIDFRPPPPPPSRPPPRRQPPAFAKDGQDKPAKKGKRGKKGSKVGFKRVDQLWDSTIHNYKLSDTAEDVESSEYDQYLFNVRRTFDWEGEYKTTVVDIKSKLLKEALTAVMDGVKGVSLVEETPTVNPNMLFLYLEDLRTSCKELKKQKITVKCSKKEKKKLLKRNVTKRAHLKVLIKYLDKDYAATKKSLYPMLESGLITFDLLWALFKPNTLAYTTTYGSIDEPRAFKIELAEKEQSFLKGEWYSVEGRYLEYDGKTWGMGTVGSEVPGFKGARKITSLNCYPLKFHKNETKLRAELIERGKKFVSLQGVNYKSHKGMAYYKKRRNVIKVNIDGRVMVDPAIHRRILPNYSVSTVKPKDPDLVDESEDEDASSCGCGSDSSGDEKEKDRNCEKEEDDEPKTKLKLVLDAKKKARLVRVPVDEAGDEVNIENLEQVPSTDVTGEAVIAEKEKKELPLFTDEEYLIASPVVLGFAFAEKLWLEFTVSGIQDIVWNEGAYDSLVLEDNTKAIVKALVESHKYHPAESIDDVIQGKGKGLVAVLHGPPGTGKTLTAEGISELLKCPLYMVSAGELGTDPRTLEAELQKILDIAHAWGAVLLLDEADVFLEKRTIHDIHRNALVSIFLRLLEYFQGILFLTTNRVETFDDAFQSRIHIALRYGELSAKAKKAVFKMFVERVRVLEGVATMPFTETDYNDLSRHSLNGRQIKNTIRTAQALAVNSGEALAMSHIKRVLDVSNAFDRDLKGGTGYEEALNHYT